MRRIYLDNAATSFPKPPGVINAVSSYMSEVGASPGRGAYRESAEGSRVLSDCRHEIAALVNHASPDNVVFTLNCSDALNLAIKGLVWKRLRARPSERIQLVTTQMDHNSVLRPYNALAELPSVEWTCVHADPETGLIDPADVADAIRPDTLLVSVSHASNVTGVLQDIAAIGKVCRATGVPLLVDAAQSIGHVPIDVDEMNVDMLAIPGHKGLLGPLGTGALCIREGLEREMDPLREGGTGSRSEDDTQPTEMPDMLEPGSHNTPGIAGLLASVRWVRETGIETLRKHELTLIRRVLERVRELGSAGYRFLGPRDPDRRVGVFSFTHPAMSPHELAMTLESGFGVLVRSGIHCAPRAHAAHGTLDADEPGACRMSFGPFTTLEDVDAALDALAEIAGEPARAVTSHS